MPRVWQAISDRRAANMLRFAADLRATGELRDDLTDRQVADLVWSMNSAEYFGLLAARGLTPQEYADAGRGRLVPDPARRLRLVTRPAQRGAARSLSTVSIARW